LAIQNPHLSITRMPIIANSLAPRPALFYLAVTTLERPLASK
jgi:hypothetical protein